VSVFVSLAQLSCTIDSLPVFRVTTVPRKTDFDEVNEVCWTGQNAIFTFSQNLTWLVKIQFRDSAQLIKIFVNRDNLYLSAQRSVCCLIASSGSVQLSWQTVRIRTSRYLNVLFVFAFVSR